MSCNVCRLQILDTFLGLNTLAAYRLSVSRRLHQQRPRQLITPRPLPIETTREYSQAKQDTGASRARSRPASVASKSTTVDSRSSKRLSRSPGQTSSLETSRDSAVEPTTRGSRKAKRPRDIEKRAERREQRAPLKTDFQNDLRRERTDSNGSVIERRPVRGSRQGSNRQISAQSGSNSSRAAPEAMKPTKRKSVTSNDRPMRVPKDSPPKSLRTKVPPAVLSAEPELKRKREPWQSQKAALKEKFGEEGYKPRKKLSPDTIEGIRALHANDPQQFTTPILAKQFEVSPEAIRRILKSSWKPNPEEMEDRRERWENRGKKIWAELAEKGNKPPKKWREMGVGKEVYQNRMDRVQTHRAKERDVMDFPSEDPRENGSESGMGRLAQSGRASRHGTVDKESNGRLTRAGRRRGTSPTSGGRSGSLSISDQIAGALDMSKGLDSHKVRQRISDRLF